MSTIALRAGLAVPLLLAVTLATTWPQDDETAEEPETELARQMLVVQEHLRHLRRNVRDPEKNADTLVRLQDCEVASLASKAELPVMLERVPEGEREAFLRDYRLEMIRVLEGFLALEKALLEGRQDELRDLYKVIARLEDPGHERFTDGE